MVQRDYILPKLPVALPTGSIPDFVDVEALGHHVQLELNDPHEALFVQDAVWRDSFILTGTLRTFYSSASIAAAWHETSKVRKPSTFALDGKPRLRRSFGASWVELAFKFRTECEPVTTGYAYASVIPNAEGQWKIWVLRTILEQIDGQPSVDRLDPVASSSQLNGHALGNERGTVPNGHTNGSVAHDVATPNVNEHVATNGIEHPATNGIRHPATADYPVFNGSTQESTNNFEIPHNSQGVDQSTPEDLHHFDCVVVGGGQAGLGTGGRLKALGISYVILEKHPEVGDSWKSRYDLTRLHTIREFAHLPFNRTFDKSYQEFLTKDDLAEGYKKWVKQYDIRIWTSTEVISGSYNAEAAIWDIEISKYGVKSHLSCYYLVFAAGAGCQIPVSPAYDNKEAFSGDVIHSGAFKNSKAWKGKHGVVVGSGNTAHDIAEDMLASGLESVTMIQRNETLVVPVEHYRETHDAIYNEHVPTDVADRIFFTGPAVLGRLMGNAMLHEKARKEPERFDALEKAGFKLDRGGDMAWYLFQRFGGHYMDVGTSAKIANGQIQIRSDSLPLRYTKTGLELDNGVTIPADLVVFATGFVGNMRLVVADLFGAEVAGQLEDYWGMDDEGEVKGAFKPSGHPAFWYVGGAIGQVRYMSRWVALQIKLKLLGKPIPEYKDTPPRISSQKIGCKGL